MTSGESLPDNDFDGPWKEVLDLYLEDALAFFYPDAHRDIDWSRGYQGLETELQQVAPEGERGAQAVDKLIKVSLRDGTDTWVLIHLEVQSQTETSFAQRMFRYHSRLYDHFRQEIVSLAGAPIAMGRATSGRIGDRTASVTGAGAPRSSSPSRPSNC